MKISMRVIAVDTFVPMLKSLSEIIDKAAADSLSAKLDLVNARLAPDMYTFAQQVQQACHYAKDGSARLAGRSAPPMDDIETTLPGVKAQITRTIEFVESIPAAAFEGADDRDCSLEIPNDMVIEMDGLRFLRAWALPHFYFHLVTAYDILRNCGLAIGKRDYVSQIGSFVRPKKA